MAVVYEIFDEKTKEVRATEYDGDAVPQGRVLEPDSKEVKAFLAEQKKALDARNNQ